MANGNHTAYFYEPGQGPRLYMPFAGSNDSDVEITSHCVNRTDCTVEMWVTWCNGSRTMLCSEYDVQTVKPNKVYEYWRNLGGRCSTTGLSMYHVFNIIDECRSKYHVRWTGYDEDEATWESKVKIKRICPRAVLDWRYCKRETVSTLTNVV
ncbi:hypothetical protein FSPOR_5926 [Fusarium sporotrichioides]|uniref:Chromo domain-containing protein n=1 Tax=Fusarium sporotrichioides TaxID=5514 RepID=A0A395S5Q3_FUSSP|nr:hypothetical protein FSPOR_5926 [Fusarium sporotrichioides]